MGSLQGKKGTGANAEQWLYFISNGIISGLTKLMHFLKAKFYVTLLSLKCYINECHLNKEKGKLPHWIDIPGRRDNREHTELLN